MVATALRNPNSRLPRASVPEDEHRTVITKHAAIRYLERVCGFHPHIAVERADAVRKALENIVRKKTSLRTIILQSGSSETFVKIATSTLVCKNGSVVTVLNHRSNGQP